jgi:hypothetical protein
MAIEIYLNINPSKTLIVDELSDYLFAEGWRYGKEVSHYDMFQLDETLRQLSIEQYGF